MIKIWINVLGYNILPIFPRWDDEKPFFSWRYYINRVKDTYRQATIDLTLGNPVTEDLTALAATRPEDEDNSLLVEKEENLKVLIDECKKMLITEPEECLGAWGLIDCDPV